MGKTLDFFKKIPELCKAKDADRWSWIIDAVYRAELNGCTPFDKNDNDKDDPDNRIAIMFAFNAKNDGAKDQCNRLAKLILLNHYINEHGDTTLNDRVESLYLAALEAEPQYPEIASVMSVESATSAGWND